MQMPIAKAIRLRDQLGGDVARLKKLLLEENVRPSSQPLGYNAREVLVELRQKVEELVKVKTALAKANAGAYQWLYTIKEWKGLAATVYGLDTRMGVHFVEPEYAPDFEMEFVAELERKEVDRRTRFYNQYIGWLQDQLDEYKHSHGVDL